MAQDVHPEYRDERGILLSDQPARAAAHGKLIAKLAGGFDPAEFPLLAGIDPYANTIFNDIQQERLAGELARYAQVAPAEIRDEVFDLARVVRERSDRSATYLWFIGD